MEVPLFSCYAFVNVRLVPETWAKVLRVSGVLRFVGVRGEGVPIPENQVESIRALLSGKLPYSVYPFLKVGQRVRVRGGLLTAWEGILVSRNGNRTLVDFRGTHSAFAGGQHRQLSSPTHLIICIPFIC